MRSTFKYLLQLSRLINFLISPRYYTVNELLLPSLLIAATIIPSPHSLTFLLYYYKSSPRLIILYYITAVRRVYLQGVINLIFLNFFYYIVAALLYPFLNHFN